MTEHLGVEIDLNSHGIQSKSNTRNTKTGATWRRPRSSNRTSTGSAFDRRSDNAEAATMECRLLTATNPTSHVAAVQSLISVPLHEVHAFTDGSDALQHPINGEKVPPSQDTIGYPLSPLAHDLRSPLTVVAEMTTSYPATPEGNSFMSGAHSVSHLLGVFTQLETYILLVAAVETSQGPPKEER